MINDELTKHTKVKYNYIDETISVYCTREGCIAEICCYDSNPVGPNMAEMLHHVVDHNRKIHGEE
jgi:hypothetical protein